MTDEISSVDSGFITRFPDQLRLMDRVLICWQSRLVLKSFTDSEDWGGWVELQFEGDITIVYRHDDLLLVLPHGQSVD